MDFNRMNGAGSPGSPTGSDRVICALPLSGAN